MRSFARPSFARLSAVTVLAVSMGLAAPAGADTGPSPLRLTSFARIVADPAHGHLFLSPGRAGSAVLVTDLTGTQVASIGALPGATGLAMTPDGTSLWVALAKGDALARIDTSSLSVVQTVALPAGTCPGDVAVTGSRVVYGYSCYAYGGSGAYGGVGVVNAATGAVLGRVTSGPYYQPVVAAGPTGEFYAADAGLSPTALYLYDATGTVTGAVPGLVAARSQICSSLRDLAAKPDGSQVVTACGSPYEHDVYSADKLASAGVYPSGTYPNAAAWSGDGSLVAVGTDSAYDVDVRLYAAGGSTPIRETDFGSSSEILQPRGLAVSPDGGVTWAVSESSGFFYLRQIGRVAPTSASLTLAADPPAAYPKTSTSLGGQLTAGGAALAGATLTVSRTFNGTTAQLPAQTTASNGTYHFSDVLPGTAGTVSYRVAYAGDGTHAATTATTNVTVWTTAPTLTLSLSQPATGSPSVTGKVQLRYAGNDSTANVAVHLSRSAADVVTKLPDVVTDSAGSATFTDTAPAGTVTYTAAVDATAVHDAASTSATVGVAGTATSLSATPSPTTLFVGQPVTVSGTLAVTGGAAVSGRTVTVTRSGCGTASTNATTVGSALTDGSGRYQVVDSYPPEGSCGYVARFAGDATYAGSSAQAGTVTVQRQTTSLSIGTAWGTGRNKKTLYVTAHLGTTYTNRTVTITVTPSGGTTVTLLSGTVDSQGNLTASYQPKTQTTYTATFSGDAWYLPATASATV